MIEGEHWDVFWAQHFVGADLLRKELEKAPISDIDPASVYAIWDESRDKHGEYTSQIVGGPRSSAIIPLEAPQPYHFISSYDHFIAHYDSFKSVYDQCRQNNTCPIYVNNSMQWNSEKIADLVSVMSSRGTTVIASAGNDAVPIEASQARAGLEEKAILVTSLRPSGEPSGFTSYGISATIAAPSDRSIRSYDFAGNPRDFGGTSGAAPLVTGSLGGFTLLNGFPLTTPRAKQLLTKTALMIPTLPRFHLLGAGMLNAYKIGMVALRIKQLCGHHVSSVNRQECLSSLLDKEETYLFEEDSTRLFEGAREFFPACFDTEDVVGSNHLCKREEAFNDLRRAALLTSSNVTFWKAVRCVEEKYFGTKGIRFLQSLIERLEGNEETYIRNVCRRQDDETFLKYFSAPSLMNLFKEPECGRNVLKVANEFLSQDTDWNLDSQEILEILSDQTISSDSVHMLSQLIGERAENISRLQEVLESILAHSQTYGHALRSLALLVVEHADRISDPQVFWEGILSHPEVNGFTLLSLIQAMRKNANNISYFERRLGDIFHHPELKTFVLNALIQLIKENADRISHSQQLLDEILAKKEG